MNEALDTLLEKVERISKTGEIVDFHRLVDYKFMCCTWNRHKKMATQTIAQLIIQQIARYFKSCSVNVFVISIPRMRDKNTFALCSDGCSLKFTFGSFPATFNKLYLGFRTGRMTSQVDGETHIKLTRNSNTLQSLISFNWHKTSHSEKSSVAWSTSDFLGISFICFLDGFKALPWKWFCQQHLESKQKHKLLQTILSPTKPRRRWLQTLFLQ